MPVVTGDKLLTAAEFAQLEENGRLSELVRGGIVEVNMPAPRHGYICGKAYLFVRCSCWIMTEGGP